MHFAVADTGALPGVASALVDQPGPACVAACYRCLMSYYNQPDHELLDRRDEAARDLLLRLAGSRTVSRAPRDSRMPAAGSDDSKEGRWLAEAARRGLSAHDAEPLAAGDRKLRFVWRRHYVAAVVDEMDPPTLKAVEDLGFEVIRFDDPEIWKTGFARLSAALGRTA
jgi:hypothetical protein